MLVNLVYGRVTFLVDEKPTMESIRELVRQHSNAQLFRMPQVEPYAPLKLYAVYGGTSISNNSLTLPPNSDIEILRWENYPAHLWGTVLGVTMPDATVPHVGVVVNFDRNMPDIIDWTIEEYNMVLGLGPNVLGVGTYPSYGGCTLYDPVNFVYVALTNWDYCTHDFLEVRIRNWTAVPVNLDVIDIQFWSTGTKKQLKYTYWPY